MDYTVHGILLARILKWVAFPFSRGSSQPRDQTQAFCWELQFQSLRLLEIKPKLYYSVWYNEDVSVSNLLQKKNYTGTPLVVQWLRICLPMQGIWVQSLAEEQGSYRLGGHLDHTLRLLSLTLCSLPLTTRGALEKLELHIWRFLNASPKAWCNQINKISKTQRCSVHIKNFADSTPWLWVWGSWFLSGGWLEAIIISLPFSSWKGSCFSRANKQEEPKRKKVKTGGKRFCTANLSAISPVLLDAAL